MLLPGRAARAAAEASLRTVWTAGSGHPTVSVSGRTSAVHECLIILMPRRARGVHVRTFIHVCAQPFLLYPPFKLPKQSTHGHRATPKQTHKPTFWRGDV